MRKQCSKCKEVKVVELFSKDKTHSDGKKTHCKSCCRASYQTNRESILRQKREYSQKNKEAISAKGREYRKNIDKDAVAARMREYREKNREVIAAKKRDYKKKNKEVITERQREYMRNRRREDREFALMSRLRRRMHHALQRGGYVKSVKIIDALGCTANEFYEHIEKQFTKGMTWENRDQWHLDHIVPIGGAETEADVYALSHFTNIRPMWASENRRKSAQQTHLI